jgi:hypothetical protein
MLGEPAVGYEERHRDARARLLKSLPVTMNGRWMRKCSEEEFNKKLKYLPSSYTTNSRDSANCMQIIYLVEEVPVAICAVAFGARTYALDGWYFEMLCRLNPNN